MAPNLTNKINLYQANKNHNLRHHSHIFQNDAGKSFDPPVLPIGNQIIYKQRRRISPNRMKL